MTALVSELLQIKRCIILPECRVQESQRFSPYILQTAFSGIPGKVMVRALDDAGFAVSTGSACSSALKKRPALEAMGIAAQTAFEAIRISQGWNTTSAEIAALIAAIKTIVSQF